MRVPCSILFSIFGSLQRKAIFEKATRNVLFSAWKSSLEICDTWLLSKV